MLTDMIAEEVFEIKEEEPLYDPQDLEHGKIAFIFTVTAVFSMTQSQSCGIQSEANLKCSTPNLFECRSSVI